MRIGIWFIDYQHFYQINRLFKIIFHAITLRSAHSWSDRNCKANFCFIAFVISGRAVLSQKPLHNLSRCINCVKLLLVIAARTKSTKVLCHTFFWKYLLCIPILSRRTPMEHLYIVISWLYSNAVFQHPALRGSLPPERQDPMTPTLTSPTPTSAFHSMMLRFCCSSFR